MVVGSAALPTATATAAAPIPVQVLSLTDLHGYLSETENLTLAGPSGTLQVGGAA